MQQLEDATQSAEKAILSAGSNGYHLGRLRRRELRGMHYLVWLAVLASIAGLPQLATGQCQYEVVIFNGPDCGGTPPTQSSEMTEAGAVTGWYQQCVLGPNRAFTWSSRDGVVTLPVPTGYSAAAGSDLAGEIVVGRATPTGTGLETAVLWRAGVPTVLESIAGANYSDAWGVNESGVVIGRWGHNFAPPGYPHAFRWVDGVMEDIKLPFGPKAAALDINDKGQIVGWMGGSFVTDSHAFVWDDGKVTDLGVIPGGFTGQALAISNNGRFVVGTGQIPAEGAPFGASTAAVWANDDVMVIQPLPGQTRSGATSVNDYGQVVGRSWKGKGANDEPRGFLWQHGSTWDLNALVPEPHLLIGGAVDINDAGQIVVDIDSTLSAMLIPIGVPQGDLNFDCRVGTDDLLALLGDWGPCAACRSDINGDGEVDSVDLSLVILNWG